MCNRIHTIELNINDDNSSSAMSVASNMRDYPHSPKVSHQCIYCICICTLLMLCILPFNYCPVAVQTSTCKHFHISHAKICEIGRAKQKYATQTECRDNRICMVSLYLWFSLGAYRMHMMPNSSIRSKMKLHTEFDWISKQHVQWWN